MQSVSQKSKSTVVSLYNQIQLSKGREIMCKCLQTYVFKGRRNLKNLRHNLRGKDLYDC